MTADAPPPQEPAEQQPLVVILNHQRDPLDEAIRTLRDAGYGVVESSAVADTHKLLPQLRPDVVVLNPLVLQAGAAELEMVDKLQSDGDPVPVIFLIDEARELRHLRRASAPLRDFLLKPHTVEELLHRLEMALVARDRLRALARHARDLEGQVSIDFKTGLLSDRHFRGVLHLEWKRALRHHAPLSLLLVDVDDFKRINDSTEYAFGDEVLRAVAQTLKQTIRETDFAARFGGDEFVLLLPQTTPAQAVQTAIRIRKAIASLLIEKVGYQRRVTVSIGIDTFDGRAAGDPEMLWRRANKALQEAKRRGKDRVWLFSDTSAAEQG